MQGIFKPNKLTGVDPSSNRLDIWNFRDSEPSEAVIDKPETNNEDTSAPFPTRAQREQRLRKKTSEEMKRIYGNDGSRKFNREEIICRELENDGGMTSWLDTNWKWKKTINIF
ncbi:hypothetical protein RhiirA5_434659 [Rhizophagus irregularis]|uniref:Uncharacterized protein n=1 Tax=Rhizophagus irregularis TaxID=588596 RepID=A0A2N0NPQ5_9GLOM|nr:hypothetical protein RhiirA5_434659 [Rhizophagus irregularis]